MPKLQVVAMAGMTQGGKTTCADYLHVHYGLRTYAFVDHFKYELQCMHPQLNYRDLWGDGRNECKDFLDLKTPREALISYSNSVREVNPAVNTEHLEDHMEQNPDASGWVLSDCRHPTEIDWAVENATVIKLLRGTRALIRSGNTNHFDWEVASRKLPYTIDNEVLTLPELYAQLDEIMASRGFLKS